MWIAGTGRPRDQAQKEKQMEEGEKMKKKKMKKRRRKKKMMKKGSASPLHPAEGGRPVGGMDPKRMHLKGIPLGW